MKKKIINLLKKYTKLKEINLEIPPSMDLGDYAFPCFQLTKKLKKDPKTIAKDLAKKIKPSKEIEKIVPMGPYLNFYLNKSLQANSLIKEILKEKNNYGKSKNKKKVMVEFISPNTNKSLHLGHVRNGLLGESVSNILIFLGYKVTKTSLNNDKGTGMSESMLGYKLFHNNKLPNIKSDHFVAKCYVDFKKAETEKLKSKVQNLNLLWEKNDKETIKLWKKLTNWVYKGYKETYKNLGISFDKEYYESKIYMQGKEIVLNGLKKGIFKKKEGAIIADLEKYKIPNKVLIRSDGTSLYMTQDLYLAELKSKEFKVDHSIYVVASEQDNHFKQLFKILELLKFKFAKNCYHLSYGLVNLPTGRMKSREGTVVDADDIIEEITALAKKEIKKRHKKISKSELEKRSKIIGLGALKFFMLKFDSTTSFTYDPKRSLSFEGDTGPYVQYTYARLKSVLKKSKLQKLNPKKLSSIEEINILSKLSQFKSVLEKAGKEYKPHLIATYSLELARLTNEFYHKHQILKSGKDTKNARLNLILAITIILENSLNLLGIESPESM